MTIVETSGTLESTIDIKKNFQLPSHSSPGCHLRARARARAARCYKTKYWPGVRVRVTLILKLVILDLKSTTKLVNNIGNSSFIYLWTY